MTYGRYNRPGSAGHREEEDRKTFQCAVVSLVAAFGFTVSGLSMLYWADYGNSKTFMVDEYNSVVDKWSSTYADPFNATKFELEVDGGAPVTPLGPVEEVDRIDQAKGMAHTYPPLRYELKDGMLESVFLPAMTSDGMLPEQPSLPDLKEQKKASAKKGGVLVQQAYNHTEVALKLMEPREMTLLAHRPGGQTDRLALGTHTLLTKVTKRTGGWKVCKYQQGGYFRQGLCTTFQALDSLCVKVSQTAPDGAWQLDDTYGGTGCTPKRQWRPEAFRRVHAPAQGTFPKLSQLRTLGVGALRVRDAHDPHVIALNITGGSLFFAEKAAEQTASGTIMIIVGAAMFVPGIVLCAPYVRRYFRGGGTKKRDEAKKEGHPYDHFDEIL